MYFSCYWFGKLCKIAPSIIKNPHKIKVGFKDATQQETCGCQIIARRTTEQFQVKITKHESYSKPYELILK